MDFYDFLLILFLNIFTFLYLDYIRRLSHRYKIAILRYIDVLILKKGQGRNRFFVT